MEKWWWRWCQSSLKIKWLHHDDLAVSINDAAPWKYKHCTFDDDGHTFTYYKYIGTKQQTLALTKTILKQSRNWYQPVMFSLYQGSLNLKCILGYTHIKSVNPVCCIYWFSQNIYVSRCNGFARIYSAQNQNLLFNKCKGLVRVAREL